MFGFSVLRSISSTFFRKFFSARERLTATVVLPLPSFPAIAIILGIVIVFFSFDRFQVVLHVEQHRHALAFVLSRFPLFQHIRRSERDCCKKKHVQMCQADAWKCYVDKESGERIFFFLQLFFLYGEAESLFLCKAVCC